MSDEDFQKKIQTDLKTMESKMYARKCFGAKKFCGAVTIHHQPPDHLRPRFFGLQRKGNE